MVMEWYILVIICVLSGFMLIMLILDWYDRHRAQKNSYIKNKEWLLMEDNTTDIYNKSFAKNRYIRTGSYIQNVSNGRHTPDDGNDVV